MSRAVANACPHGVQHHIASQLQQVGFALHDDGFESALKNVTNPVVGAVVSLGINAVELAHTGAQVAVDGLYNHMKVVVHQAVVSLLWHPFAGCDRECRFVII